MECFGCSFKDKKSPVMLVRYEYKNNKHNRDLYSCMSCIEESIIGSNEVVDIIYKGKVCYVGEPRNKLIEAIGFRIEE